MKSSLVTLTVTALLQTLVVVASGSVALLADTLHNFADAGTAVPLWLAFVLQRRKPSKRFTYGYGRVEDLAGLSIVLVIALTALFALVQSVNRLLRPQPVEYWGAVMVASIIGFLGNELVARLRMRVGIGSAALIADGYHARVDGLTSLAVLVAAGGTRLGYPLADPIVGLLITAAIGRIVWESGKSVLSRILDGVEPELVDAIREAVRRVPGVLEVAEVRVRWLGHKLHGEVNLAVAPELSVGEGHDIANEVHRQLLKDIRHLSDATIHVDPLDASGEEYHSFSRERIRRS